DPALRFVFPTQSGGVPDTVTARKAVRRKLDRAGFPWATFHTLRRTVERQLMDASVDPRVIMAVMGHDPATSWASYVDHKSVDVDVAATALASHPRSHFRLLTRSSPFRHVPKRTNLLVK